MQRHKPSMNRAGFTTVNPSTGEEFEAFSYFTPAQTEEVVSAAGKRFQAFRKLSVYTRAAVVATKLRTGDVTDGMPRATISFVEARGERR